MRWLAALVLFAAVSVSNGQTVIAPEHGLTWDDPNITWESCRLPECVPDACTYCPCGWPDGYKLYYRLPGVEMVYAYDMPVYRPDWPGQGPVPNVRTNIVKHLDFLAGTVVCFAISAYNGAGESCLTAETCVIWPDYMRIGFMETGHHHSDLP